VGILKNLNMFLNSEMANGSQLLLVRKQNLFLAYCGISNIFTGLTQLFTSHGIRTDCVFFVDY